MGRAARRATGHARLVWQPPRARPCCTLIVYLWWIMPVTSLAGTGWCCEDCARGEVSGVGGHWMQGGQAGLGVKLEGDSGWIARAPWCLTQRRARRRRRHARTRSRGALRMLLGQLVSGSRIVWKPVRQCQNQPNASPARQPVAAPLQPSRACDTCCCAWDLDTWQLAHGLGLIVSCSHGAQLHSWTSWRGECIIRCYADSSCTGCAVVAKDAATRRGAMKQRIRHWRSTRSSLGDTSTLLPGVWSS